MGQLHHDGKGNFYGFHPQRFLNGPGEPLVVRHGVVQGGLRQGEHQAAVVVFKMDAAFSQLGLAVLENFDLLGAAEVSGFHPGLVGAGNVRHQDGDVRQHLGAAGQPPAGRIFLVGDVAALGGFQLTLDQLDLAFAAGAVAPTGGINGHIAAAGQLQKIVSGVAFNLNRAPALNLEGYLHGISFLSIGMFFLQINEKL